MRKRILTLVCALFASAFLFAAIGFVGWQDNTIYAADNTINVLYYRRFETFVPEKKVVKYTTPSGQEVIGDANAVALTATGVYVVEYEDETVYVKVYSDVPSSEFSLLEHFESEYASGENLRIPAISITSEIGDASEYFVIVEKDGTEIFSSSAYGGGRVISLERGEYSVTYGYADVFGYISNKTYEFSVTEKAVIVTPVIDELSLGESYDVSSEAVKGEQSAKVDYKIIYPSGKVITERGFTADEVGTYTLEFTGEIDGEKVSKTLTVGCVLRTEDLFTGNDLATVKVGGADIPSYSRTEVKGLQLSGYTSGASYVYRNTVDVSNLTADENLISFVPLSGEGYGVLNSVIVEVRDAYDENNSFSVCFWQCPWVTNYVYVSVGYKGKYAGVCNEWYDGKEHNNELRYNYYYKPEYCYGAILFNHSFIGDGLKNLIDLSVRFDYASGKVYSVNKDGLYLVRDLGYSGHVGSGNEFKGFTNGKAKITVTLFETLDKNAGIVVTEFMGERTDRELVADTVAPELELDYYGEDENDLPYAIVGKEYKLPDSVISDLYSPYITLKTEAFSGEEKKTGVIDGNVFTPDDVGDYEIVYSATDAFGNTAVKKITVTARTISLPVTVTVTERDAALSGRYYLLPEITATGGSGKLKTEVGYLYNGNEVTPDAANKIYISEYGELSVTVKVTDYLGDTYTQTQSISLVSYEPTVRRGSIPKEMLCGEKIDLPSFVVSVYNGDETVELPVKAFFGGREITNGEITAGDAEEITVLRYEAYFGDKTFYFEYSVKISEQNSLKDFFIENGGNVDITEDGTVISLAHGENVQTAYPVAAQDLVLRLTLDGTAQSELSVKLEDAADDGIAIKFKLYYYNGYVAISSDNNGKYVTGSAFNGGQLYLYFDYSDNSLKDALGNSLTVFGKSVRGDVFEGFPSGEVYLTFTCEKNGVKATIVRISNQGFLSYSYKNGDTQGPIVSLSEYTDEETTVNYGERITVLSAKGTDVLSAGAECFVTVIDPAGNVVLQQTLADVNREITASVYGAYSLVYTAKDVSGNATTKFYTVRVKDDEKPQITYTGKVKDSYKVGDKIKIPDFTVTDNNDTNPEKAVFIVDSHGKYRLQSVGKEYVFKESGVYRLVLYARDSSMNVTTKEFIIRVK